ncbi:MAG: helix-turn-helix domain-containing protein [Phycisphaerae bacterium]|nr:helix-turn-helix domain-containing protein [Phycisphaerae bacterium]
MIVRVIIAEDVGLPPRHLTRLFRDYEQESVHATLLHIRVTRAREALAADPARSVKQIAHAAGFRSASHFTQCFKRIIGRLPGETPADERVEPVRP